MIKNQYFFLKVCLQSVKGWYFKRQTLIGASLNQDFQAIPTSVLRQSTLLWKTTQTELGLRPGNRMLWWKVWKWSSKKKATQKWCLPFFFFLVHYSTNFSFDLVKRALCAFYHKISEVFRPHLEKHAAVKSISWTLMRSFPLGRFLRWRGKFSRSNWGGYFFFKQRRSIGFQ